MALKKTKKEIDIMREGGLLLSKALTIAVEAVHSGVSLKEIDAIGEKALCEFGATPSFKGYKSSPEDNPFPSAFCLSVNEEVVHGCGNRDYILKESDLLGLDVGCWYKGLCTDMAATVPVGKVSDDVQNFVRVTKESLFAGVSAARVGGSIQDISKAIQDFVNPHGYSIVRALVGHGVGHAVHEAPHVPNFISRRYPDVKIVDGMCLAIEPMLGFGKNYEVETTKDGWGVKMKDCSLGCHFEVTIVVTNKGVEVLTPMSF